MELDVEQRLYVIPCEGGYTCLGFDYAFERASKVAAWLWLVTGGRIAPDVHPLLVGTREGYNEYLDIMSQAENYCKTYKNKCPLGLHPQLVGLGSKRVEVVDQDNKTYRFWVGKSGGWLPVHLAIKRSNSSHSEAVDSRPFKSVRVIR